MDRRPILIFMLLGAFLVALPFFLPTFGLHLAATTIIWVMLALSFNVMVGGLGELSFGHAAFYGIGAYSSTLLVMKLGVPIPAAIVAAMLITGAIGFLVGIPAFQTRGHYFALVSMGFGELVVLLLINWESLTEGFIGIRNIPGFGFGEDLKPVYFLLLAICALVVLLLRRLQNSHVGEAFDAIREDTFLAESIGIPAKRYKLLGMLFSTAIAGLAGALVAHLIQYISPTQFDINATITINLMTLVGGVGTLWGPIVGAIFLQLLPEMLHGIDQYRMGVYGLILILVIIFLPGGLASLVDMATRALARRQSRKPVEGLAATIAPEEG